MDIITELTNFYDNQAWKFHNTRKKHWPEFEIILKQVNDYPNDTIKILELWCWSWRLLKFLKDNSKKNIIYQWVDISNNLIQIAKLENPNWNFIVGDMLGFLENQSHEIYDIIIAVASFQHIDSKSNRILVLKNIYKTLNYWWLCIMTNWSFSNRFINKYKLPIFNSLLKFLYSWWYYKYNDIYIPWNTWDVIYKRFYHLFTISELKKLFNISWFIIRTLSYCDKSWNLTSDYKISRNSIIIWEKNIVVN